MRLAQPFLLASLLTAGPVLAQEPLGLMSSPIECAALESLVVFGLIDGGIGGDTTELTQLLNRGDGEVCLARLWDYGYGSGFLENDCRTAFDVLSRGWFGPTDEMSIVDAIALILAPPAKTTCDDILFDMTAGL